MNKTFILVLFSFFYSINFIQAQDENTQLLDSLVNKFEQVQDTLSNVSDNKDRLKILNLFRINILNPIVSKIENNKSPKPEHLFILNRIYGTISYYEKERDKAISYHKKALDIIIGTDNDSLKSLIHREIAILYYKPPLFNQKANADSSLYYFDKAWELETSELGKAKILHNKGMLIRDLKGDFQEAEKKLIKANTFYSKVLKKNNPEYYYSISNTLNELGETYFRWGLVGETWWDSEISTPRMHQSRDTLNKALNYINVYSNFSSNKNNNNNNLNISHLQEIYFRLAKVSFFFKKEDNYETENLFFEKYVNFPEKNFKEVLITRAINEKLYKGLRTSLQHYYILGEHQRENKQLNLRLLMSFLVVSVISPPFLVMFFRYKRNKKVLGKIKIIQENQQTLLSLINQENTSETNRQIQLLEKYVPEANQQFKLLFKDSKLFIGLFNDAKKEINFPVFIEDDQIINGKTERISKGENLFSIFYNDEKTEFILNNNFQTEFKKYLPQRKKLNADELTESVIYLPLKLEGEKPFGVISVQSDSKNVYKEEHLETLKLISKSLSIALWNAKLQNEKELITYIIRHRLTHSKVSNTAKLNELSKRLDTMSKEELKSNLKMVGGDSQMLVCTLENIKRWVDSTPNEVIKFEKNFPIIEVKNIAQDVFKQLSLAAQNNDIQLINHVNPNLSVEGIELYVQEILLNLVINAIQSFKGNKKKHKTIEVYVETISEDMCQVCVKDNSSGIDSDIRKKLFTSTKYNKKEQSGFGTVICKILIEKMRQSIEIVDSNEQEGTLIAFTLPKAYI